MKLFSETFKLYAYKNKDRCDLSIKINDTTVFTVKLTHEEIQKLFNEYNIIDEENRRWGVEFQSQAGQFWFVMLKKHFDAVRITLGIAGVDFNFRVSRTNWDLLKTEYENQIANPMPWDNK